MSKRKVFTENDVVVFRAGPGTYKAVTRDQMPDSNMPKVTVGNAVPTITPVRVGDIFVDTTNNNTYLAQGILSASNWALVDTDASAVLAALITTGTSPPGTTPTAVGLIFIDTNADNAYISVGTSNSADWALIDTDISGVIAAIVSKGAGAPVTTPSYEGLIYIDTTADTVYLAVGTASSADWQLLGEKALRGEELTATGDVDVNTRQLQLNHDSVAIVATIAAAPANELLAIRNSSGSGSEAHSVVLTSGTFDGVNSTVILNTPGDEIFVLFNESGDGQILFNKGMILLVEELTVTGNVNAATRQLELNHIATPIVATIAVAPQGQLLRVKNTSASGTEAHSVVLTSGTWDGTNNTLVLDRPGVEFVTMFDENGDGRILQVSLSGTGAPAFRPLFAGQVYVDETADKVYIAVDTSAASDWKLMLERADLIETGAGAPSSTPTFEGQIYIDTTADEVYVAIDTSSSADWKRILNPAAAFEELTVTGGVAALTREVLLNHISTPIVATKAAAPAGEWMKIKNTSASGSSAHTCVLTSGTWDGTNNIATLDAPDEEIVVWFDSNGNGTVIVNLGTVAFST